MKKGEKGTVPPGALQIHSPDADRPGLGSRGDVGEFKPLCASSSSVKNNIVCVWQGQSSRAQ